MFNKVTVFLHVPACCFLASILLHWVAVLPELKDRFGFAEMGSGALFAILPVGVLTGSLLFGYFCDRYGYKWILVISCVLIASGLAGIVALRSLIVLKGCIFFFGVGGGCINGSTNALVSDLSPKNKGANLSLLGVFYAVGALEMPLILGLAKGIVSYTTILLIVAVLAFLLALILFFVRFPPAKHQAQISLTTLFRMFQSRALLLIAFFLFFQSGLETITYNWITSYLMEELLVSESRALYVLTLNVLGMALMRLLIGSVFRKVPDKTMLVTSLGMLFIAAVGLYVAVKFYIAGASLFLMGAGMAAGFLLMYGVVGKMFPEVSATAFSFVLTIALTGNMLINFLVGTITKYYGMNRITTLILIEVAAMIFLYAIIVKNVQSKMRG